MRRTVEEWQVIIEGLPQALSVQLRIDLSPIEYVNSLKKHLVLLEQYSLKY